MNRAGKNSRKEYYWRGLALPDIKRYKTLVIKIVCVKKNHKKLCAGIDRKSIKENIGYRNKHKYIWRYEADKVEHFSI